MFSLFPATYFAYHRALEGQALPKLLLRDLMWTVALGHPNTQPDHSLRHSDILGGLNTAGTQRCLLIYYSSERKGIIPATGRISTERGMLIGGEFSFFFFFGLTSYFLEQLQFVILFELFIWRTVWDCVCMCVSSDMYVCAFMWGTMDAIRGLDWAQQGRRARWRDRGKPGWNGRVIGWDEKWESLTFCYLQGCLIAWEPIQSPHPCATPSPIKIFNYRDGRQEGWR